MTIQTKKTDDKNVTYERFLHLQDWMEHLVDIKQLRYGIMQVEAGETGRLHIQGYLEWMRPKRLSEAKSTIGYPHANFQPRWGTRSQAREYCMKDEVWTTDDEQVYSDQWRHEVGQWREDHEGLKGERSLSDIAVDLVVQGYSPRTIAKMHPKAYFTHSRKIWDLWRMLHSDAVVDELKDR